VIEIIGYIVLVFLAVVLLLVIDPEVGSWIMRFWGIER
jgi:hypothetical protein